MCLGCMHFRAPHTSFKQKIYHNSLNLQPIIGYILGILKFVFPQTA